ncbi:hypothetical protein D3C87_1845850 [compost metagenome]
MCPQLAGGPSRRRAPFRALIGGFETAGHGFNALFVAPLGNLAALVFKGAQQTTKARRYVSEAGQHQLPGNG